MLRKKHQPIIRKREDHCISRKNIDPCAIKVLYRLSNKGFTAYLVGGGVRDLLLGLKPKDFDISTDAHPNQIKSLFRNAFLIGRRFRLAHIRFGQEVIETSTFRSAPEVEEGLTPHSEASGALYQHRDNTFGTPEEDAERRDFTVNGLFYDIKTFDVIDFVGGLKDLDKKVMRCIGDPNVRFREDPVRMMRAVRFAARLGFSIHRDSVRAINRHHAEIEHASPARLLEEIAKLFGHESAESAFRLLWKHRLMQHLLPEVEAYIKSSGRRNSPLWKYLGALDACPELSSGASNTLRFAVLLYPLFLARVKQEEKGGLPVLYHDMGVKALEPIAARLKLPKRAFYDIVRIYEGQRRFEDIHRRVRPAKFAAQECFPEMLALRRLDLMVTGGDLASLDRWEKLLKQARKEGRVERNVESPEEEERPRRKKRRRPRRPRPRDAAAS